MQKETLERLLNKACEIILTLEQYADPTTQSDINTLFDEINGTDAIDDEMRIHYSGDDEAQDAEVFGVNKI